MSKLEELAALVEEDKSVPQHAREVFAALRAQCCATTERIEDLERQIVKHARHDDTARRLATIPGIGPITASLITAAVGKSIKDFKNARHFAAWLGMTPRQHSTGGKTRLGRITKTGNREIRHSLSVWPVPSPPRVRRRPGTVAAGWSAWTAAPSTCRTPPSSRRAMAGPAPRAGSAASRSCACWVWPSAARTRFSRWRWTAAIPARSGWRRRFI